ncbi:MAG: HEPN domain-containing protein [Candidatus Bathyarchaeia archaeon]
MSRREEAELLKRRGLGFLEAVDFHMARGHNDLAAFSLEQAIQLTLKSALLKRGFDYPRTHSPRRLMELLIEIDETLRAKLKDLMGKYLLELALLEDAYVTSRYVARDFSPEEIERLSSCVEEVLELVGKDSDRGSQA